ncbi:MAG: YdiL family protein [Burkholderiales bacterium]|nr:YdiL family protein [Burkholderiales bacterium]
MTSHELKHIRTLLGFSPAEAAELVGEVSEEKWLAWEEDANLILPEETIDRLMKLCHWHRQTIVGTLQSLQNEPKGFIATMVWYDTLEDWTATGHSIPFLFRPYQSVCTFLREKLPDTIVFQVFNKESCLAWLKNNHLPESELANDQQVIRWATELTVTLSRATDTGTTLQ